MLPEELVLVFYHCLLNFIPRLINLLEDEAASALVSSKTCLHSSSHDHSSIFFNTDVVICLHNICPTHKSARFVTFCFFFLMSRKLYTSFLFQINSVTKHGGGTECSTTWRIWLRIYRQSSAWLWMSCVSLTDEGSSTDRTMWAQAL